MANDENNVEESTFVKEKIMQTIDNLDSIYQKPYCLLRYLTILRYFLSPKSNDVYCCGLPNGTCQRLLDPKKEAKAGSSLPIPDQLKQLVYIKHDDSRDHFIQISCFPIARYLFDLLFKSEEELAKHVKGLLDLLKDPFNKRKDLQRMFRILLVRKQITENEDMTEEGDTQFSALISKLTENKCFLFHYS